MPQVTGLEIARDAYGILGVYSPVETPTGSDGQLALRFLNDLLSEWSQRAQMIPVIARLRFSLVANQGGPTFPYTIGPGGDFDTPRPPNQNAIQSANLILTATVPEVRVPLGLFTDETYDWNQVPDLMNSQPTGLYYSPTYQDDFGTICLWPVPTVNTNDLELFVQQSVAAFADLSTEYWVPSGLPRALKYNLAASLQEIMGKTLAASAQQKAVASLGTFMRSNLHLVDLRTDAAWAGSRSNLYNINTGTGGGA